MFYAGLDFLFNDEFSTEGMKLQFAQFQHQSTPIPSTDEVCSALMYRKVDPIGRRHEYTEGFPHEVSATEYLIHAGGLRSPM